MLTAFYMFGWYSPVFYGMYELMPGVKLFRRPADATFLLGGLLAFITGYLLHCWLQRQRRAAASSIEIEIAGFIWWRSSP